MVADSTTDSQLFHGSPISRAFFKKPKANCLTKLKQWKIDDPRRSQWIHQWKRANVVDEDGCSRLNIKTLSYRFSQACRSKSDDDAGLSAATSSPTSALKNNDSDSVDDDDCFCCSKQVTVEEEEEVFPDANDNSSDDYSDALSIFYDEDPSKSNNKSTSSTAKPPEKPTDEKKEDEYCPICIEKMDATDLLFKACSDCVYKMCLFCYHTMINEGTGVCLGCRTKYEKQTSSSNSAVVTFQQPGGDSIPLSSSFQGLDSA